MLGGNTNPPPATNGSSAPLSTNSIGHNFPNDASNSVANNNASGGNSLSPNTLYKWHFRTSNFNSFNERLDDIYATYTMDGDNDAFDIKYESEQDPFDIFHCRPD